jgi:hypothetical protein
MADKFKIIEYTFLTINVLFICIVLLQIIYIRVNIASYENEIKLKSESVIRTELDRKQGNISVYGLIINKEVNNIFNNPSSMLYLSVRDIVNKTFSDTILPYSCVDNQMENINVTLLRFGILCLDTNSSSLQLIGDCVDSRIKYIVIKNHTFLINYDNIFNIKIKEFVKKQDSSIDLSSTILFSIHSLYNKIEKDILLMESKSCVFNLKPLIGNITDVGYRDTIELNSIIGEDTTIHAIGYSV